MASLKPHFKIDKYDDARSHNDAMIIGNKYRITILSDILIRLEFSETGTFEDRPTELIKYRNFEINHFIKKEDETHLVITTSYFKLEYQKERPFIGSKVNPDQFLKITLNNSEKFWYYNHPEARNFKGTGYSLDNADGNPNYKKGLYSTDGFVSIDDSESLIFNKDGSLGKRSDSRIDIYVFLYRKDFGLCLRDYFRLTGKPSLIPRYALGIWWNKDYPYTTEELEELIWNFNKNKIPLSIILLSKYWHILYNEVDSGFTFNYNLFNNPKQLIDMLHNKKIKIGLNINPMAGIHPDELSYKRFKEAALIEEEGILPFNVFNKNVLNSYLDVFIKPLNDLGVDFYWIDYYNSNDLMSLRALNHYHYYDYKQSEAKRGMILSRNGLLASHKYPVIYSGYTKVSWNNLDLLPEYNLTSSNIGINWISHDIGGYLDGIEDPELYMRFIQLGTFSPILRLSSAESHYYKREPWLWDAQTFAVASEYLRLRHRLIPYLYSEGYKYSNTGLPLIQPIYYRYPEIYDEPLYKNEYYFGTELFIAPITKKKDLLMNRTVHRIFLPNGVWYDFKTGKKFIGGKRYVSFFKDEDYPVFAKKGTIVPLAILDDEDINNTNPPAKLEIHIFPGRSNTYKFYEDDGISSLYKDGYYLISDIDYNYQVNNFTAVIRPTDGKSGIVPIRRNYIIRFRNTRKADEVILYIGEDKKNYVKSYVDGNDFIVEVNNALSTKQVSINCKGRDIEIEAERIINEDIDSIISDLKIKTSLKEKIAAIIFSDEEIKRKRIEIRKLRTKGLTSKHIRMFIKLLEYIAEI
ncbi:MAG: glycoside hydrolase family 31 protein [Bacilli bacterium]|nr:glycoside hydrolase family 31 protein [Bacilli bacterium]MDD4407249.1 glycoside hydrolase family 31 protein [Bacilli bacterium]